MPTIEDIHFLALRELYEGLKDSAVCWALTGSAGFALGIPLVYCPLTNMDNASVSLLSFHPDPKERPSLLCLNWTSPAVWLPEAQM